MSILKKGNRDQRVKNYGKKIRRSRKQVGKWKQVREQKQVKDEAQGLLNVERRLIVRYLLSLF